MTKTQLVAPTLLTLALALAACSEDVARDEGTAVDVPALTEDAETVAEPDVTAAEQPAVGAAPETVSDTSSTVPAKFVGRWDAATGTCSDRSEMQVEIAPTEITFYESFGEVQGVRNEGGQVIVDVAMQGEGQRWENSFRLRLTDDGQLYLTDPTDVDGTYDFPHKRCPSG